MKKFATFIFTLILINYTVAQTATDSVRTTAKILFKDWKNGNTDALTAMIDPTAKSSLKEQITSSFFTSIQAVKALGNISSAQALNYIPVKVSKGYAVFIPFTLNDKIYTLKAYLANVAGKYQIIKPVAFINGIIEKKATDGMTLFKSKCFSCHGLYGEGMIGPNLSDAWWKYAKTNQDVFNVIKNGKQGTIMIAFGNYLKDDEIHEIMMYLSILQGQKIKTGKPKEGSIHKRLLKNLYLKRN